MTGQPEAERQRAARLAYEQGQRDAQVDGRLNSHEDRLRAINGSIDRHARTADALKASIEELREDVANVAATLKTNAAVERDRVEQVKRANDKQISTKMFWLGIAAIIATILAAVIASHGGGF